MERERARGLMAMDMTDLIKVGFAEAFGAHERVRMANGKGLGWVLTADPGSAVSVATDAIPMDELPQVQGTQFALLEYLNEWINALTPIAPPGERLVWGMQRTARPHPQGLPIYCCRVVLMIDNAKDPKDRQKDVGINYSTDPGMAIAAAMLQAKPVDLYKLHREVFPHRYLLA